MNSLTYSRIAVGTVVTICLWWGIQSSSHPQREQPLFTPKYPDASLTLQALNQAQPSNGSTVAPVAVLVGHHLVAAGLFRDTIAQLPSGQIKHVILIGPNHFLNGRGRLQTLQQDLATPYGRLRINASLTQQLHDQGGVTYESATFLGEHGIANILPYIKKLLPAADVTPIAVWPGLNQRSLDRLREAVRQHWQPGTVVIGSFDFSHYVTSQVAVQQDAATMSRLSELDLATIKQSAVDSPEGLWLLVALARDQGATRFALDRSTNSGLMTSAPPATEVTSYITGRFVR